MSMGRRPGCRIVYTDGSYTDLVESYDTVAQHIDTRASVGHYTRFDDNKKITIVLSTISRVLEMGY